ncbi:hypothetical protein Hdeb2414_s0023g00628781 [Helianthus debilis subsp. tardiflorus]
MKNKHFTFQLQIMLASLQFARKCMRRVASELDALDGPTKEFLGLQGVRFDFSFSSEVTQFWRGFKVKSTS